jgi:hypothetical protein
MLAERIKRTLQRGFDTICEILATKTEMNALTGNQNDWLGVPHIKDYSVNLKQPLK